MSKIVNLAAFRAAKISRRRCIACGDGPLIALEHLGSYHGPCCIQHEEFTNLCEGCGQTVLADNDRPNKPRRA
jgi:ribosomal protein S27AE